MTSTAQRPHENEKTQDPLLRAEHWLRAEGFPLVVPGRRRLMFLFPRTAPVCLWLAGTALLLTLGWWLLESLGAEVIEGEGEREMTAEEAGVLLASVASVLGGPVMMLAAAWWFARGQRHWPLTVNQVLGGGLWTLMVWALGPWFGDLLGSGADPMFAGLGETLTVGLILLVMGYLGLGSMARWAVVQSVRELASLVPMVAKVLPIVMLAVLFLFVNAEIWKVADSLSFSKTFGVVSILGGLALLLMLAGTVEKTHRLLGSRQASDREAPTAAEYDHAVHTAGGPWPALWRTRYDAGARLPAAPSLGRMEWLDFTLVPLLIQFIQAALFSVLVFAFFVGFGAFAIPDEAAASWINHAPKNLVWAGAVFPVKAVLVKVSMVIGVFAGLSFAASTSSDPAYRADFLDPVLSTLHRSVLLRHLYRG